MSTEAVWSALVHQANLWKESPILHRFSAALPRNAIQQSDGLASLLQYFSASGVPLSAVPLRAASILRHPLAANWVPIPTDLKSEFAQWFTTAERIERAHNTLLRWARARLPRYPRIVSPHLAIGSPYTATEFPERLPWTKAELSTRLQFEPEPPALAELLGLGPATALRLGNAARALMAELANTAEWQRYSAVSDKLDDNTVAALRSLRKHISNQLTNQAVSEYEPNRLMRRLEYRIIIFDKEIKTLTGRAKEYFEAFKSVDNLINTVLSAVFGQRVCYGPVQISEPVANLEFLPGDETSVSYCSSNSNELLQVGQLLRLPDDLLDDALLVTSLTVHFEHVLGLRQFVNARVLPQSRTVLGP